MHQKSCGVRRAGRPLVAVALAIAALAAGCGEGENASGGAGSSSGSIANREVIDEAGPPRRGGQLRIGLAMESENFSPVGTPWGASTYAVGLSIMEPLATYDVERQLQPYLAKGFTSNDTFTEWTISLRDGVRLSDGRPVDAELVKVNFDAQRTGLLTSAAWGFVQPGEAGVAVVDPRTVVVRMSRPWSTFPHLLSTQAGIIASPETVSGATKDKPVGSGPFVFKNWERDRRLVVTRNPDYWRAGYPYLDEIEFRPLPDVSSRGKALESGDVHVIETGESAQILAMSERAKQGQLQMFTDEGVNSPKWSLALNVSSPPFDDPVARRAVAHAIDTAGLSQALFKGVLPPVRSAFGDADPFHADVPGYPDYDPDEARKLAREYQERHGRPIAFEAMLGPGSGGSLGLTMQQQLRDVGIELSISTQTGTDAALAIGYGRFQATIAIFFGSPHIDREFVFLASPATKDGLSLNFTRIGVGPDGSSTGENDRLVAAMTAARATGDAAEQKRQYEIVQQEMAKNLNMVFLLGQPSAVVADRQTRGLLGFRLPDADGGDGPEAIRTAILLTVGMWRAD